MNKAKEAWSIWPDYNLEKRESVIGELTIYWKTRVRKKSQYGFYFLTKVGKEYRTDLIGGRKGSYIPDRWKEIYKRWQKEDDTRISKDIEEGTKLFVRDVYDVYMNIEYSDVKNQIGEKMFIIDRYQGRDHTKIDPEYMFLNYSPDWDWETLKEKNKQL